MIPSSADSLASSLPKKQNLEIYSLKICTVRKTNLLFKKSYESQRTRIAFLGVNCM
jgi:hypothetical protein